MEGERREHLVHVFDGFRVGGTEVRTARILNAIGEGYRHTIVSLNGNTDARGLLREDLAVTFLTAPFPKQEQLRNVVRSRRLLGSLRPDLLITYGWSPIEWVMGNALAPLCPMIQAEEGFADEEMFAQIPRRRLLRRLFFGRCTRVVVCSRTLAAVAVQSWRLNPGKVMHIPNGVDIARFAFAAQGGGAPGRPLVLGIVASLLKVKNHVLLLAACARAAPALDFELRVVGDGPQRGELERMTKELGLESRVIFMGHRADPAPVIAGFDIFCLSSRSEQMPLSVLEAMAAGKPVVSTNAGDVGSMLCDENAPFVVGADDCSGYAAALVRLGEDRSLRERIGEGNRKKCRGCFSEEAMFEAYTQLYATVLHSGGSMGRGRVLPE